MLLSNLSKLSTTFTLFFCPVHALAGAEVEITIGKDQLKNSETNGRLFFDLKVKGKKVKNSDLKVTHTKKLHLMVFDQSLTQFFHLHPNFEKNMWQSENFQFQNAGIYHVWADGAVKGTKKWGLAQDQFTVRAEVNLDASSSRKAALPKAESLETALSWSDEQVEVRLMGIEDGLKSGSDVMPLLKISRKDGSAPKITPYLGSLAHVIIVALDGKTLLHVHPMDGGAPNQLKLHTMFPEAGDYRVWVEFIEGGVKRVAPLAVRVASK